MCVVDQNAVNTFDSKTFPIKVPESWTVMFIHSPRAAWRNLRYNSEQANKEDEESYMVLVREKSSRQKEVKIYARYRNDVNEIDIIPSESASSAAMVSINGKQIQHDNSNTRFTYGSGSGRHMHIYYLSNSELKISLPYAFDVVYDGKRVKLIITANKFRKFARGLCGDYNGESSDDLRTPENCLLADYNEFVNSYVLPEQQRDQQSRGSYRSGCYKKKHVYANVVSDWDTGRRSRRSFINLDSKGDGTRAGCTRHQTRYSEDNDQLCFTVRPLPVCLPGCKATGNISKLVPVHCVEKSNLSFMWKTQIDKGANPDFSLKTPVRSIRMDVPLACYQN